MEELELTRGHLPKRTAKSKPFWYIHDWSTFLWGELLGCSLFSFVVGYVYRPSHAPLVLVAVFVGFALTLLLHTLFVSIARSPGSHYPKAGVVSWNGALHIGYYFWQLSFATYLVLLIEVGKLSIDLLALVAVGFLVYFASLASDIQRSQLAPRKK